MESDGENEQTVPFAPDECSNDNRSVSSIHQTCSEDFRDGDLNVTKAFYGILMAGMAFLLPFLPVFYKMNGITASENGLLGGLRPLVNFWSGPLLSGLADKLQRRRLILFISAILYAMITFSIWFVPAAEQVGCGASAHCVLDGVPPITGGNATIATTSSRTSLPWKHSAMTGLSSSTAISPGLSTESSDANATSSPIPIEQGSSGSHTRTLAYFVVMIFFSELVGAPVLPLTDTIVLETLGHQRISQFGRQRLWGAVGYGIANAAAGFGSSSLADSCGRGNYTVHFVGFAVLYVISLAAALKLKDTYHPLSAKTTAATTVQTRIRIGRGLRLALCNARAICFLVAVFFLAIAMSIVDNFLFWFLTELCASELLLGLSILTMCMSEIPLFLIAGRVIKRFGHTTVLVFVLVCYAIRFLAYSLLENPWLVMPIEPLHGVCFALMWSCCVSYCKKIAPPNLEATLQGVLNGLFWGVGRGTGAVLGGFVYHHFGARWLFRSCAIMCCIVAALYLVSERIIRQYERRHGTLISGTAKLVDGIELNEHGLTLDDDNDGELSNGAPVISYRSDTTHAVNGRVHNGIDDFTLVSSDADRALDIATAENDEFEQDGDIETALL
ncbi:major facilitator superfamily domain-containing protein 6-like [Sycon ciliatum]|uniref:major facilitator superfamily domain-containing protein 6-like n=1 Tax=Sycon ciliatum TaxID=27933 RepID=UPI0031F620B5